MTNKEIKFVFTKFYDFEFIRRSVDFLFPTNHNINKFTTPKLIKHVRVRVNELICCFE